MTHRVQKPLPSVLPERLSDDEGTVILQHAIGWSWAQSRGIIAGVKGGTYDEIAAELRISANTIHAHFDNAGTWAGRSGREATIVLAVATLWRHASGVPANATMSMLGTNAT
jgi:hypothetical protein